MNIIKMLNHIFNKNLALKGVMLWVVIFTSLLNTAVYAASVTATEKTKLRVAISVDYHSSLDRVLYMVLSEIGYGMVINPQEMMSAIESVNSGESDILELQQENVTDVYDNLIKVPEPITRVGYYVFVRKGEGKNINTWKDFSGEKVGLIYEKPFIQNHIPLESTQITYMQSHMQLMAALSNGEIDYIVTPILEGGEIWLAENVEELTCLYSSDSFIYVNKFLEHLVPDLAAAIKKLKDDGTIEKILNYKYIPKSSDKIRIMQISSYSSNNEWVQQYREGLKSALSDWQIDYKLINLNSEEFAGDNSRAEFITSMLRSEYYADMPNVILVSDDAAYKYIRENYYTLFYSIPIVVTGLSELTPDMTYRFSDFLSGATVNYKAKETIDKALELFPNTKNIFVINDYTETGIKLAEEIKSQLKPYERTMNIVYSPNVSLSDLLIEVSNLPDDTVILNGKYSKDATDKRFTDEELGAALYEFSNAPIFGLISPSFGYGQLGGKYVDAYKEGFYAGGITDELLKNPQNTSSPIATDEASFYTWMFDKKSMDKFDIKQSQLPSDSQIINVTLSLYEQYPQELRIILVIAILATIVLGAVSFFIVTSRRTNRKLAEAQKSLHSVEELLEKDRELAEAKERLEHTINSAPIGFVTTKCGICETCNEYAQESIGFYPGLLIEKLYANIDETKSKLSELDFRDTLLNQYLQLKTENGESKIVYTNFTVAEGDRSRHYTWFIDLEESEKLKAALLQAQTELQKLVDSIPSPVIICNGYFTDIVYANQDALEFCDAQTIAELQKDGLANRLKSPNNSDFKKMTIEALETLKKTHQVVAEWIFEKTPEQAITVKTITQPIEYHGQDSYVIIMQDIDSEKQKTHQLFSAAEAEKKANSLKSRFLVSMSHEIRTPMNAIVGLANIELCKEHTKEMSDLFKKISLSSKNLLTIIDDILDFSKIEAEELVIHEEEIELEEVLSGALLMATQRVGSKMVEILLKIEPNVPNRIYADQARLWQILKNLLDNSAKYTQIGKIQLNVALVSSSKDVQTLSFSVIDTGFGMSPEQLERLFTPYEQFHSKKDAQVGTGLGMTITKQLIELMNGDIEVWSKEGEGTELKVTIPFRIPADAVKMEQTFANVHISKNNILIVDDEPVAVEIMTGILSSLGVTPISVSSGERAVEVAQEYVSRGEYFNIIIVDYMMEDKNGIDTARQLKSILGDSPTKLLLVSAYVKQLMGSEILSAGFDDIIEKPFCPTEFIRKLCDAVDAPIENKLDTITFEGARVLLVEDNLTNQEVAIGILEIFGIAPDVANNGRECLQMLEEEQYDLILMDILMPEMDGHQATRKIRSSNKPYRDIPIIAMTANVMRDEIDRCFDDGMNAHVGKPISMERLQLKLAEWLPKEIQTIRKNDGNNEKATAMDSKIDRLFGVEGLDARGGLERFMNREERYILMLLHYIASYNFESYEDASKDQDALKRHIHDLKGVSGNLGINTVYTAARQYEISHGKAEYDTVVYEYQKICRVLNQILAEEGN